MTARERLARAIDAALVAGLVVLGAVMMLGYAAVKAVSWTVAAWLAALALIAWLAFAVVEASRWVG